MPDSNQTMFAWAPGKKFIETIVGLFNNAYLKYF